MPPSLTINTTPIEAPEQMSPARRAAEAAFAPPPIATYPEPVAEIHVRRKKAIAIEPAGTSSNEAEADPSEPPKAPRTFRAKLPESIVGSQTLQAAATATPSLESAGELGTNAAVPRRPRRKRVERAPVTIIRPAEAEPIDAPAERRPTVAEPATGDKRPEHRLPGASTASTRRYAELMTQIAKLQAEAERARKSEAAEAIRWIRKAIDKYDLDAAVLGL